MEGLALTGPGPIRKAGLLSLIVLEMAARRASVRGCSPASRWWSWARRVRRPRSRTTKRSAWWAVAWATRCCFPSRGRSSRTAAASLLRWLQEAGRCLQAGRDRGRHGSGHLGLRRPAAARFEAGAASAAGSPVRRQHRRSRCTPMPAARSRSADPDERCAAHHRHRIGPHDGRGGTGPTRRAATLPAWRSHRHRQHQLTDAVHDERGLRPVPAEAHRPGHRQRDRGLLVLQPGSEPDRVSWQNLADRLRQNSTQEKLSNHWLDHLLK